VGKIKPFKTVEAIAKKHRLDVSFIQKQLDMGEPIEHEHTKDHELAREIALQHLDEIPDYYTRLKKMEASAKKEHQKFKDVTEGKGLWANIHARRKKGLAPKKPGEKGYPKTLDIEEGLKQARKNVGASKCWTGKKIGTPSTKMKGGKEVPNCVPEQVEMVRYCPRCQKEEIRSACKYGPKYWDMFSTPVALASNSYDPNKPHPANEEKDHEHSMARSELSTIVSAAKRLQKKMKGEGNIEAWVQSKITKAADYLDTAADYVDSGEMKAESVSFKVGDRPAAKPSSAATKIRNMSTAQQAQLPKEKVKKVIGTDLPRFNKESVDIQDANGNTFAKVVDIIGPDHMKPIIDDNGVWKGSKQQSVSEEKTFQCFMEKIEKSKMKCNSPKSDPVGDSLTGKSHVVKACSGGKEKIIRFGQRGVKGSPKKKGESKEYASRRNRFKSRHAKNISKGPMSAAYWANKVKW
jgi:uncharacterized protein (UPF0333 family)